MVSMIELLNLALKVAFEGVQQRYLFMRTCEGAAVWCTAHEPGRQGRGKEGPQVGRRNNNDKHVQQLVLIPSSTAATP